MTTLRSHGESAAYEDLESPESPSSLSVGRDGRYAACFLISDMPI